MLRIVLFSSIFTSLMFIWTYVYLNKSANRINQTFLLFLAFVMAWMVLGEAVQHVDYSMIALIFKTIYWHVMLNLAVAFLVFVYRLINRPLDVLFFIIVGINTLTILWRYSFPIDYAQPNFWRLSYPVVAPLMSFIFSIPAIYALYLMIAEYSKTKESRTRRQLRDIFIGIGLACIFSIISEYVLPVWFGFNESLMNLAIFVLVLLLFHSIFQNRFLSISSSYLCEKLLSNANDGIIIVNRKSRIASINEMAVKILHNDNIRAGDRLTDYIKEYSFLIDYHNHEITLGDEDQAIHLMMTQHFIDGEFGAYKLMTIIDITNAKRTMLDEKDRLLEQMYIDSLTGLYNKHCFMEKYYQISSDLNGQVSALLFIDIDGFKAINDTYGHLNGDTVLQALAEQIKLAIGDKGMAFRFGGDEFVVLLKYTIQEDAYRIAENIRARAYLLEFPTISASLQISLSIGLMQGASSIHEMMRKADIAMYDAKSKGKNMTSVFMN